MKTRHCLVALLALATSQSAVYGLNPPSDSDGPVRLLNCIVNSRGILEAEVDSQSDDDMECNIRCNYELGGSTFTQTFSVTIRKRFQGRVGRFDTNNGKPGSYSGDIGSCTKVSR
jgi:hypothetical protein